jgi:hypothetical protein
MPQHRNSASRLHTLLRQLPNHTDNTQNLSAWASAFQITEPDGGRQARLVTEHLASISRELDYIRDAMRTASFSPHLYEPALSAVDTAISPLYLGNTWNHVKYQLKPEHLIALEFCGEILADEEDAVPPEDLEEIARLLAELEALLDGGDRLPGRLRELLERQTKELRVALAEYPIAGAKGLRNAVRSSYGELVEAKDLIAQHKEEPEVSKFGEIWRKINAVSNTALKIDGVAQLGQRAWLLLESIIKSGA